MFPGTPLPALNAPLSANAFLFCACAVDAAGNVLIADQGNNRVFRVNASGVLSVVAGNGLYGLSGAGGLATAAALANPAGVAMDGAGNVFIVDTGNVVIRKVSPAGIISTVAGNGIYGYSGDGGPATKAEFGLIQDVVVDTAGNLYVADYANNVVRKVSADGRIATVAGTGMAAYSGDGGPATAAGLNFVQGGGLAVDGAGNLYIADFGNHRIRKVTPDGKINTVAGTGQADFTGDGGPAGAAALNSPSSVAADGAGSLYIADFGNSRIRKVSPDGKITTVAGNGQAAFAGDGGPAIAAATQPATVRVDSAGNLYISELGGRLRKVSFNGQISTIAGNGQFQFSGDGGPATRAAFSLPTSVATDKDGNVYVVDAGNSRIRKITPAGAITTFAGNGTPGALGDGGPATAAEMAPIAVAADTTGNIYFVDPLENNVRKVSSAGIVTLVAGSGEQGRSGDNGPAVAAALNFPTGVAVDAAGNIYIADSSNNRVRMVSTAGIITTVAGSGKMGSSGDNGPATAAAFDNPTGLAVDRAGNIYIADSGNNRIRKVSPKGVVTTVAGNGTSGFAGDGGPATSAELSTCCLQTAVFGGGVAVDSTGTLYIADSGNYRIRAVSPAGVITTVAGIGNGQFGFGFSGDGGPATSAELNFCCFPSGIFAGGVAVDGNGNLYLADTNNNRVRAVLAAPPLISAVLSDSRFSGASAGTLSPAQVLTVFSSVPFVPFTVSVSPSGWLSVDATSGMAPRTIQVTADPTGLSPGSYSGIINVNSAVASPASISIPVTFIVGPGQAPVLAVDHGDLTFTFPAGAQSRSQSIRVMDTGGGAIFFAAEVLPGAPWLSVDPPRGRATPSAAVTLAVTANPAGLPPGVYTGRVDISSLTAGGLIVPVTMIVSASRSALLLSQAGVSFTAVAGGGVLPPRDVGVLNLGSGALQFSTETSTLTGGGWLKTTASADPSGPPSVTVNADQSGLAAGTYYGLVKVRSAGAANSPQVATAVLRVLPAGTDVGAVLTPNELTFNTTAGAESPGSQSVLVYSLTAKPKSFTASSSDGLVEFSPGAAVVNPQQPAQLVVQPFTNSLAPGTYRSVVTLQFDDLRVRTIGVTIVVTGQKAGPASLLAKGRLDTAACQPTQLIPALTSLGAGFSVPAGFPVAVQTQVQDDCGAPLEGGSVVAEFSNGDPPVALRSLTGGRWDGTWQTRRPVAGVTMTIRATSPGAQLRGSKQIRGGFDSDVQAPVIAADGIADAASNIAFRPLTPGGLITIAGSLLSDQTATQPTVPYGTTLANTSIMIGGNLIPVATTGPNQVSAIIPYGIPVNSQQQVLVLRANAYSLPVQVNLAAASPAIFTTTGSQAMILDANGKVVGPGNAAKAGDRITIWCTGLGELQEMVTAGNYGPASSTLATPVSLSIGRQPATIQSSGLAPQLVGIYFVQATVPSGVAAGDQVPVTLTAITAVSPTVTMAVTN